MADDFTPAAKAEIDRALQAEFLRSLGQLEREFGTPNCTCYHELTPDRRERRTTPHEGCPMHGHTSWEQPA